jgi:hypothetical protein
MQLITAVMVWLLVSCCQAALAQDNAVRVAVIEALSGPLSARGQQSWAIYKKEIDKINKEGFLVGQRRYRISLIGLDSQSNSPTAIVAFRQAIIHDRIVAAICSDIACRGLAEEYKVPTVLTVAAFKLTAITSNNHVFLINAPHAEDFETQARLATIVLREAIIASREPTPESVTRAFRSLSTTTSIGSIKFDNLGNNIGVVPYRFRATSRPDAAGCTRVRTH